MKVAANRAEAFAAAPDPKARAVLVYGEDDGLVRERIERLARGVVPDRNDPFRLTELTAAQLRADPARLADEAAALAFGGGRRVVVVRDATDALAALLDGFLAAPPGDALLLVGAGGLGPRSPLRRAFEEAATGAALPCYADEGAGLESLILDSLRRDGLTAEPDALAWLAEHLGADRRLTRAELAKLALYMGGPGRLRLEDAQAAVGDAAALSLDDAITAAAEGDHAGLHRRLDRLFGEGNHPVTVVRAAMRHFQRLHLAAGLTAQGRSVDQAMAALKPPVIWRHQAGFRAQLARWPADRLATALDLLLEAEIECKTTGNPAEALCARTLTQLARAARAGRR